MVPWNKSEDKIILEEKSHSKWLWRLMGVLGFVVFTVGIIGFSIEIEKMWSEGKPLLHFFTSPLFTFQFLATFGAVIGFLFFPLALLVYLLFFSVPFYLIQIFLNDAPIFLEIPLILLKSHEELFAAMKKLSTSLEKNGAHHGHGSGGRLLS